MLNPSQQKAVEHDGSHLLIVAGPGTGKTFTLVHRMARIAAQLKSSQKVLAITFTHKAAEEMRSRLAVMVDNLDAPIFVGTFHQFCLNVLKEKSSLELPADFRIASEEDVADVVRNLWPEAGAKERNQKLLTISKWKSVDFKTPEPEDVKIYTQDLRRRGWLDFDDLQLETLKILESGAGVLNDLRKTYPAIFVDEYQDINAVQHALLRQLAGPQNRITAIGDPNQAIYGFRGSDVRFFETFTEDFSPSEVFHLSDNYRSAKNLLSASGQVMSAGGNANIPELTANIYAQGRLIIHAVPTEKAEAEYVVHQIEKLVGGTSMFSQDTGRVETEEEGERTFGDIAILYRLNSQRYALQKALDRSGIPYNVTVKKTDSSLEEDWQGQYSKADEGAVVDSEKVSLMTLHASKGLEFPVVFIVGCENQLLPLNAGGMISDIEEERRLFYVGMTRAKERLYMIRAKQRMLYGQKAQHDPSPFLADIEEGLKEYEKIVSMSKSRKKSDLQFDLFQ